MTICNRCYVSIDEDNYGTEGFCLDCYMETIVGSPEWQEPERMSDEEVDILTDGIMDTLYGDDLDV